MERLRVLVADRDEPTRSETAAFVTEEFDADVQTAESVAAASELIETEPPTVLVTGYAFPDGNGLELVELARERNRGCGCILYTHSEAVDTTSFENVIVDFVPKEAPDAEQTLRALIEQTGIEQSQAAHPVPEREQQRLDATEAFAEQTQTEPFRRISRLAADHFGLDSAAIVTIHRDDVGVLTTVGPERTPRLREQSLGAHTLTADQQVVGVEDTRTDPRFADINAIHEAGIVSYLGGTIRDPEGLAVGVLSVYGTEPRTFDAEDRAYLGRLATLAGDLLDGGEQP
ncbi:response regulator [Halovenus sp. WSH3]|uniref:Response regulator n=1 Tax=Halovenus carboxidivorans TaxID=2692199 RepID=A0A6B0T5S5_9EURY|nr:GAF domain-containing protein [Halovenus carboxidivorans]MXR52287.1 response regulator [Halovenus carboxidivorans]